MGAELFNGDGRTERHTKLVVAFGKSANAPKNLCVKRRVTSTHVATDYHATPQLSIYIVVAPYNDVLMIKCTTVLHFTAL